MTFASSYSIAAMWSPLTPRCLPTCVERLGRPARERISSGGVPIAPAARISTLHSTWNSVPLGWRVGSAPSLSICDAVTM